jgi:hypothetical protein
MPLISACIAITITIMSAVDVGAWPHGGGALQQSAQLGHNTDLVFSVAAGA